MQLDATLSETPQFLLDTWTIKVLLFHEAETDSNRAYGVQVAEGAGSSVVSDFDVTGAGWHARFFLIGPFSALLTRRLV